MTFFGERVATFIAHHPNMNEVYRVGQVVDLCKRELGPLGKDGFAELLAAVFGDVSVRRRLR